jgi:hypothetical protein
MNTLQLKEMNTILPLLNQAEISLIDQTIDKIEKEAYRNFNRELKVRGRNGAKAAYHRRVAQKLLGYADGHRKVLNRQMEQGLRALSHKVGKDCFGLTSANPNCYPHVTMLQARGLCVLALDGRLVDREGGRVVDPTLLLDFNGALARAWMAGHVKFA